MDHPSVTVWGIHAGQYGNAENIFFARGYIAIGWELGHLGELPNDQEAFKQRLAAKYPEAPSRSHALIAGVIRRFVYDIKIGDAVVCRPKKSAPNLVFLGRVAGPYLYNPLIDPEYADVRRVEWLRTVPVEQISVSARQELAAWMTLFKIDKHADEYLALLSGLL